MKIFDSHVHFVDPARPAGVVWPLPDSPVFGCHMPEDLMRASVPTELTGCIAVETSRRTEDDDWLMRLAQADPLIEGVVLNLQPDLVEFESRLAKFLEERIFVGIRFRPVDEYDLESTVLNHAIELLQRAHKTVEFGARTPGQKASFARLAERYSTSAWILNHCGHPAAGTWLSSEWRDGITKIAALPNTACKVSSNYSDPEIWESALSFLLREFGPDRLMYGSNWPVCMPTVDLSRATSQFADFFAGHGRDFFEGNARRVYGVARAGAGDTSRGSR